MSSVHWPRVWTFLALTFAATWFVAFTPKLLGIPFEGPVRIGTSVVCMWIPGAVAWVLARRWYGDSATSTLGLRFHFSRGLVWAFVLPIGASLIAWALTAFMPGVDFRTDGAPFVALAAGKVPVDKLEEARAEFVAGGVPVAFLVTIVAGVVGGTFNTVATLGEELGWRGLLFNELKSLGFWASAAFTGVVWGLWHAPLILQGHNYPDRPIAGVFFMCHFCLAIAPMHAYSRERNDSTIAAALTHGAVNASAGIATLFVMPGAPSFLVGMPGVPGLVAGTLATLVVWTLRRSKVQ